MEVPKKDILQLLAGAVAEVTMSLPGSQLVSVHALYHIHFLNHLH